MSSRRASSMRIPREQEGQMVVFLALIIVVVAGIVSLAVDIGLAYHQRQQYQNLATNAALAGSYEVYGLNQALETPADGGVLPADQDRQVFNVMKDAIEATGVTVANASLASGATPTSKIAYIYSTRPADPCAAHYTASQVYLEAHYLDVNGNEYNPAVVVGSGVFPSGPSGVKVESLGGCGPAFFASVLGRKSFSVSADASVAFGGTPPKNPPVNKICVKGKGHVMALDTGTSTQRLWLKAGSGSISAGEVDVNGTAGATKGQGTPKPGALWLDGGTITTSGNVFDYGSIYNPAAAGTINGQTAPTYPNTTDNISAPKNAPPPIADPWSGTTAPTKPAAAPTPCVMVNLVCTTTTTWTFSNNGTTYSLSPGYYNQSLTFPNGSIICLQPGTYYVDGTWTIDTPSIYPWGDTSSPAHCPDITSMSPVPTDPGFLFYFASGHLQITGNGALSTLTAYGNDPKYTGLLYWQASTDTVTESGPFAGGGWYAPSVADGPSSTPGLTIAGHFGTSTSPVPFVIAKTIALASGGSITADSELACWNPGGPTSYSNLSPYMIWGHPTFNDATGTFIPMLFGANAPGGPAITSNPSTQSNFVPSRGDLITLAANSGASGSWVDHQYLGPSQGATGTVCSQLPKGSCSNVSHDPSQEGCFVMSQTSYSIGDWVQFNHGGVGHCTSPLPVPDTVITVPVVYDVDKNGQVPPNAPCYNGGYCEVVQAIVDVHITIATTGSGPLLFQGYIVDKRADPNNIVQAPLRLASGEILPCCG